MTIDLSRRGFLGGLGAVLIVAPAIVRATSLMPVKVLEEQIGFRSMLEDIPGAYWVSPQDIMRVVEAARKTVRYYPDNSPYFDALKEFRNSDA
jgi:hypothetical protein